MENIIFRCPICGENSSKKEMGMIICIKCGATLEKKEENLVRKEVKDLCDTLRLPSHIVTESLNLASSIQRHKPRISRERGLNMKPIEIDISNNFIYFLHGLTSEIISTVVLSNVGELNKKKLVFISIIIYSSIYILSLRSVSSLIFLE